MLENISQTEEFPEAKSENNIVIQIKIRSVNRRIKMFEKPWNSVKRMLLTGLCLAMLFAPYESEAAPKKETKKERRERLKREAAARKRRQKTPQKKKITPTFEEKLTPAQVDRKIQTIRKRIEIASENTIPAKDKKVLLEVFDDMVQTPMGRYIFEKAHPDLNFKIESMGSGYNGTYSDANRCINFAQRVFEDIHKVQTPEEKLYEKLYIAHVTAHEATHSIQHINNMNRLGNMSFEERITINKLYELHSILNETMVRYQIGNLPKYRHMTPTTPEYRSPTETEPGKVSLVPMHLFFRELKEAKMATGADEKTAERFARTKFVESFWQNKGQTPIKVGNQTVMPTTSNVSEVFDTWNGTYDIVSFKGLLHDKRPYHRKMQNIGISKNIQRFIDVMGIDTPASFFRDPQKAPFKMLSSKHFISCTNGVKDLEMDILMTGYVKKFYRAGRLSTVTIYTTNPKEAQKNGPRTEYHDGTSIKRVTYTYQGGKMNGIYQEYDRQGRQTMEIPIVDDIPTGKGWIMENNVRTYKKFEKRQWDNSSQVW